MRHTNTWRWCLGFALALLVANPANASDPPEKPTNKVSPISAPEISLLLHTGIYRSFGETPRPVGGHDLLDNGFGFQVLELGLNQKFGKYVALYSEVDLEVDDVELHQAYGQFHGLPLNLEIRLGYFRTHLGFENERELKDRHFVDLPLALGRNFGPHGHRALGADLSIHLPVSWTSAIRVTAMTASGDGQRSWYGSDDVAIDTPLDLAYHLGLLNSWRLGAKKRWQLSLSLDAILGPNHSGRSNATNVFGAGLGLSHEGLDNTKVILETEWYLRRRQVPGDLLQDVTGWAQLMLYLGPEWGVGGRYELATGVTNDPLDPLDEETRHRAAVQVVWSPSWCRRYARLRLQGSADFGGMRSRDASYGALLHVEIGGGIN